MFELQVLCIYELHVSVEDLENSTSKVRCPTSLFDSFTGPDTIAAPAGLNVQMHFMRHDAGSDATNSPDDSVAATNESTADESISHCNAACCDSNDAATRWWASTTIWSNENPTHSSHTSAAPRKNTVSAFF